MGDNLPLPATEIQENLISSFVDTTSSSREEARSFLETHQWNLDAAVSAITENNVAEASVAAASADAVAESNRIFAARTRPSNFRINIPASSHSPSGDSPDYIPSESSPSRIRYPSRDGNPFSQRRKLAGNIFTLADISGGTDSDSDESQEYNGKIVVDVEDIDGQPQVIVTHTVIIWRNGYTLDDNPLSTLDNPGDAAFLEIIQGMESPREFDIDEDNIRHRVKLIRRQEEDFNESPKPNTPTPFSGVGRTLSGSDPASTEPPASSESLTTTPPPSMVDPDAPTTSIQIRLADGTGIVSRFNTHQTVRDVRGFIDASRPDGSNDYQLLIMGFPPKPLPDVDQTIEKAGISNSVLIQKY